MHVTHSMETFANCYCVLSSFLKYPFSFCAKLRFSSWMFKSCLINLNAVKQQPAAVCSQCSWIPRRPPCLQNAIDEAVEMYQELHMWDDCIAVAEARVSFFKTQTWPTAAATPTFVTTPPASCWQHPSSPNICSIQQSSSFSTSANLQPFCWIMSGPPRAGPPAEELLPLADGDGAGREGWGGEGEPGRLPGRRQPLFEGRTAGQSRQTGHQSARDQQQQRHRQPHRRRPPAGGILWEGERASLVPGQTVDFARWFLTPLTYNYFLLLTNLLIIFSISHNYLPYFHQLFWASVKLNSIKSAHLCYTDSMPF